MVWRYIKYSLSKAIHSGNFFLVLGKYEESWQEIEKLNGVERRLSNMQRLQLRLWHMDYMISVKETDLLQKVLKEPQKLSLKRVVL